MGHQTVIQCETWATSLIREGIIFHIEGLIEDGLSVPEPSIWCQEIQVPA